MCSCVRLLFWFVLVKLQHCVNLVLVYSSSTRANLCVMFSCYWLFVSYVQCCRAWQLAVGYIFVVSIIIIVITTRSNCIRFCFWRCLWRFCVWNISGTDFCQIHREDVFGPSLGQVWRSRSKVTLTTDKKRGFQRISRERLDGFAPNSHGRHVWSLA